MRTKFPYVILILALILSTSAVSYAQKATEIYIPIGQSPGLSGQYSIIGTISSINTEAGTFMLTDSLENVHSVLITDSTRIWLDKSKINARNTTGTLADLNTDKLVEVKFYLAPDSTYLESADWIKVEAAGGVP